MPRLRLARLVVSLLGALALCLASVVSAVAAPPPQAAAERYIVVLHDRVVDPDAAATELGRRHGGHVGFVYQHALKGFSIELPARAAAALARDPRVAYVERDQEVSAFGEVPTGVDRIEVDKKLPLAGTGYTADVDIAIIDSGIASHPDLNVYRATDCTGGGPFSRR